MNRLKAIMAVGSLLVLLGALVAPGETYRLNVADETAFFHSIAKEESQRSWAKVGDRHLKYRAHGAYQIRYPAVQDVNNFYRKEVLAKWGRLLTPMDMHNPEKARWTLRVYLYHWGKRYQRVTGKQPTAAVYARIHNGGPNGWKTKSTLAYWKKVSAWYHLEGFV